MSRPAADEHVRAADARQGRAADVPRLLVPPAARRARSSLVFGDGAAAARLQLRGRRRAGVPPRRGARRGRGQVYNLGCDEVVSLARARGAPRRGERRRARYRLVPFPADRKAIDIGDYYADYSRRSRASSAGSPTVRARGGPGALARRSTASTELRTGTTVMTTSRSSTCSRRRRRDPGRARRGDRARPRRRLGSSSARRRGVRGGVRQHTAAPRTRSASPRAPTRSTIALQAVGVEPGDEVITAANTCVPTVAGIEAAGATPVLVDVDRAHAHARPRRRSRGDHASGRGRSSRCTCTVSARTWSRSSSFARDRGLAVVEDAAQAHGATYSGRSAGTLGDAAAFSFYPTKNLGALGDAGAVVTNDDDVAERARLLRNYGERQRYESVCAAGTAGSTRCRRAVLAREARAPRRLDGTATRDRRAVSDRVLRTRRRPAGRGERRRHVYHLFVLTVDDREAFRRAWRSRDPDARALPAADPPPPGVPAPGTAGPRPRPRVSCSPATSSAFLSIRSSETTRSAW